MCQVTEETMPGLVARSTMTDADENHTQKYSSASAWQTQKFVDEFK